MPVPYATVDQFLLSVDERLLANLGSDTNADGTVDDSNDIIVAALTRASHDVMSYALRGGNYTSAQLDALQTAEDWTLIGLVCDLAINALYARRGGEIPESVRNRVSSAMQTLLDLRDGKIVFSGVADEKQAALVPEVQVISATVRGQSSMVSDSPFFPRRATSRYG